MKKAVLICAAAVTIISAVDWDAEQVIDPSGLPAKLSILTLDQLEIPHILFYANDAAEEVNILKYASPTYDGWLIMDVDSISQFKNLTFSFDYTPSGAVMIAYTRVSNEGSLDVFLACDSSVLFDITNLTDDPFDQFDPVVKVGSDGITRLVYREQNDDGFNIRYGWLGAEGLQSESIKDSMSSHLFGFDFLLDTENEPHVFYCGDGGDLWYAVRAGANDWTNTSLELRGNQPSAAMDADGYFHIGCETAPNINYVTNASGSWTEEMVEENNTGDQNWVHPSLAVDTEDVPHLTWYSWTAPFNAYTNEVWYTSRTGGSWSSRDSLPPNHAKQFGQVNPFHIDSGNYGHICYSIYDTLYYVKTAEPLISGIIDSPDETLPVGLTVSGQTVRFSLSRTSPIRLDLYDAAGRKVMPLISGTYPAGEHAALIDGGQLSAGVYFVRGEIEERSASARFVKVH